MKTGSIKGRAMKSTFISVSLLAASLFTFTSSSQAVEPAKTGVSKAPATGTKVADSTKSIPKIMPWKSFKSKDDEERTYNIFKYNIANKPVDNSNPDNWRSFDPRLFAKKNKLVPDPDLASSLGPTRYASSDLALSMDPSKTGALEGSTKIVFAHQGTPLTNGWVAPEAGFAYQMQGVLVYGTTNYTPVNYNGSMQNFIGLSRVPVDILSPSGAKEKLDLGRLVFAVNNDIVAKPHLKVYPALIYLKPGETVSIQGHGNVPCPRPERPELISIQTPDGPQTIKVLCAPDDAVIPGKVTP